MVLNEVYTVMATDALTTSHPLSFREDEINTPAQISEVFDTIAYSKVGAQHTREPWVQGAGSGGARGSGCEEAQGCTPGSHAPCLQGASVLRMLSDFLTEDVFKEGLQVRICRCRLDTGPLCGVGGLAGSLMEAGASLGASTRHLPLPTSLSWCSPAVLPPHLLLWKHRLHRPVGALATGMREVGCSQLPPQTPPAPSLPGLGRMGCWARSCCALGKGSSTC